MTRVPPLTLVRQFDTHRLVPSRHLRGGDSVFTRLTDDEDELQAIFALDAATNDRLMAEHQRFAGIGVEELVFGVPCSHVVNATFCHPHPLGARFNGPDRGAWYAAFALETSQAEVAFHKAVELAEASYRARETEFGAWIRVAFDGEEPLVDESEPQAPITGSEVQDFYPDEEWPDD